MFAYGASSLIGTAIALPILSINAVVLRFYVRLRVRHTNIWIDDWLALIGVVLVCGHGVIQILGAVKGVGGLNDPEQTIDRARIAYQQKLTHAILVIEKVTYTSTKLSVLFLYRRIFGSDTGFRKAANVLMTLIVLWGLFFLFLESFICVADSPSNLSCKNQEWALLWFAITEVLGDIAILSLPYPMIRNLHMSRREKVGLTGIFALGTLSTVFGVIRLGYVAKTFHAFFHPDFVNKTGSAPSFWTTAEVSIGVVAACLPPLGPLIRGIPGPRKLYHTIRQSLSTSSRSTHGTSGRERLDDNDMDVAEGNHAMAARELKL